MVSDTAALNPQQLKELNLIVGDDGVITRRERMTDYAHDEFPAKEIQRIPRAVVMPRSAEEVSKILLWAGRHAIPVTARGGGTGMCGGCIPSPGGIILSLERMNRVIRVERANSMAIAEAGVRLKDFYTTIEKEGLFFPPHPGDESATIGGAIATNAGGARAVKYGVVRNFVQGIEVVLADGKIVQLGGSILKNSTGYSLLHLMIGSEGTLGIITKAVIRLLAPPKVQMTLIVPFNDLQQAVSIVPLMGAAGILPMAVEFLETDAIHTAEEYKEVTWPARGGQAHLMIILDGPTEDEILRSAEKLSELCTAHGGLDVVAASGRQQQRQILAFRSSLYETFKQHIVEVLDIVLPPEQIPAHIAFVHQMAKESGLWLPSFGHVADGNVHTHVMNARWVGGRWEEIEGWKKSYPSVRDRIHEDARTRGGMVSGEHGIGILKKQYLKEYLGPDAVDLMRRIKQSFDPKGILNPDKIL